MGIVPIVMREDTLAQQVEYKRNLPRKDTDFHGYKNGSENPYLQCNSVKIRGEKKGFRNA
jgi:hypothetical protein